ncbi:hypothetical protein OXYTRIMIC_479 [Oxytricha trifallax]|uniref:Uncharacterized protein n=1 Tax=Oxytricha trifallax TaxID=1172189 RepID=A0A073HY89_9SPIT|nr:hypothetical protein OXYTRIMIC_479 [Oxytricha trifallax]
MLFLFEFFITNYSLQYGEICKRIEDNYAAQISGYSDMRKLKINLKFQLQFSLKKIDTSNGYNNIQRRERLFYSHYLFSCLLAEGRFKNFYDEQRRRDQVQTLKFDQIEESTKEMKREIHERTQEYLKLEAEGKIVESFTVLKGLNLLNVQMGELQYLRGLLRM